MNEDSVANVLRRFGIALTHDHIAGGNYAYRGRLDDGSWLVCIPEDNPPGWYAGIYPHDDLEDGPHSVAYVFATSADLCDAIGRVLDKARYRTLHISESDKPQRH